jgi:hypothetical protein
MDDKIGKFPIQYFGRFNKGTFKNLKQNCISRFFLTNMVIYSLVNFYIV